MLAAHHRFTGLAFAVGEPSFEVVSCPRFDMAPERETVEMVTRIHRETHQIEQTQEVIPVIFRETNFG